MMTKNMKTKEIKEAEGMLVCSICGELHPKRFMSKLRGQEWICCSCAYECYACHYGELHINPTPYLSSLRNGNLSTREAKRVAKQYADNLEENYLMMNEFDDYRNVFLTMFNYIQSGYEGSIVDLYEEVCDDASRLKFERRTKEYLDMERIFKIHGKVNYDNFDDVLLPKMQNPTKARAMFKLVPLDPVEIFASVYYMEIVTQERK